MCMQFNKHCILCVQYCVLKVEIIALDRCISSQKHKAYKQQHRAIELETGKIDQFNTSRWIKPSTLRAQQRAPQVSSMHLLPDLTYSIESHQNAAVQSHNFYKTEQKILLLAADSSSSSPNVVVCLSVRLFVVIKLENCLLTAC